MDGQSKLMENVLNKKDVDKKSRGWWNPFHLLHNLYDWVLSWAETPYGVPALFILAFAESSFFPVPPDILLIALALAIPTRAFRYAFVCSLGSIFGGMLGYVIGWQFYELIGRPIVVFYNGEAMFDKIKAMYDQYGFWAVFIAGFTPIPYKIFTIASGVFKYQFFGFFIASALSRSARFFLVSGFIWYFGPKIKSFIDKYFELLVVAFTLALLGGFFVVKFVYPFFIK
jgi:membrane protein YqaA with SNARE-associated domain